MYCIFNKAFRIFRPSPRPANVATLVFNPATTYRRNAFLLPKAPLKHSLALLFSLALLATPALADGLASEQKERLIGAIGRRLEQSAYAYGTDFSEWTNHVDDFRDRIDSSDTNKELAEALQDALERFDLSHLSLFTPERARLYRKGKRMGVGVSIQKIDEGIFVTSVLRNSPAWQAGIRKLDTITKIDGEIIKDIEQLRGEPGDEREIEWIRDDITYEACVKYHSFELAERSEFYWITEEVAVLRVQSFQYRFYKIARINRYINRAREARAIIVDLRNNRGGLAFYSQHLASKFVNRKSVFSKKINRKKHRKAVKLTGNNNPTLDQLSEYSKITRPTVNLRPFKGELIILTDSLSASGADIFPASMKENGRGTIIGEKTSGALQLSRSFDLPYGFRLYTPVAEILTPDGNRLEGNGLDPDVLLSFEEAANDRIIFDKALEELGYGPDRRRLALADFVDRYAYSE